ncbi:molecular chaperone TorD family protein [Nitratidesulfovibrio liaohensis]|uniref:Molecular chaperone TorD family protein n=1 Tax=Nitratidesulfovibrio liaohensis TaxID=2604158 RepID=A0ABY9R4K0_9BACT|nr:molecular chaperone TorD family protein [Nitratidesulfovibrio liaohensis]WMW66542.1 molecular chaperone TorD family protein [Nitratidesulfovibrio liaohensis]
MEHTPAMPGTPPNGALNGASDALAAHTATGSLPPGKARQSCLLRGLRDLFAARGADDLRAASLALDDCVARYGTPAPLPPNASAQHGKRNPHGSARQAATQAATSHAHDDQWRDAEYAFNRLFVGPMAVPAPPYASAWLETEPRLMGESTMDVRGLYHALGYAVPDEGATPDDHLSFELDAALALLALRDAPPFPATDTGREHGLAVDEAWCWLVAEHMGTWVPRFVQRALAEPGVPPAIARALALLLCWQEDAAAACARRHPPEATAGASALPV